jgi:hypothetical protein
MLRNANINSANINSLMNSLKLTGTPGHHTLEDPFVDYSAAANSSALSATAADYAPLLPTTTPAHYSPRSLAHGSSPPSDDTTVHRTNQAVAAADTDINPDDVTRYVKISGPIEDEAGMTRIKDVG